MQLEFCGRELLLPGDLISDSQGLISGSNTYEEDGKIYSATTGTVTQTNKLLLVKPVKSSYDPQIGEIVIGRVLLIKDKRWLIDIGSSSEASLQLNSTYLPEQRQKTEDDEMNMRYLLAENEYVCAEVHSINNDKSINLHTRSLKYGKLENGRFIQINHYLVVRQKKHFIKLCNNIQIILGHNGLLFLSNQDRVTSNTKVIYNQQYSIQQRIDIGITGKALQLLQNNQIKVSQANLEKMLSLIQEKYSENECVKKIMEFIAEQK